MDRHLHLPKDQRGPGGSCLLPMQRWLRGEPVGSGVTSASPQLQDPGEGFFGAGVDEVRTGSGIKGLPVSTAKGGEFVHGHEALIALPPVGEMSGLVSLALVHPGSSGKLRPRRELVAFRTPKLPFVYPGTCSRHPKYMGEYIQEARLLLSQPSEAGSLEAQHALT